MPKLDEYYFTSLNFSSTQLLFDLCLWNVFLSMNKLFSSYHIYIYMYLCFLSERQRRNKEKKEEDENKLRDGGNSSSFKKGRKDSIVDAKRDSWRSSERKGESKNHPWIDRFIICRRFVIRALPFFVCLWDRDIDAASCDDFRDSSPLWRRWQNG